MEHESFFKWIRVANSNTFRLNPDGGYTALYDVTRDTVAEYRASVLPPDPTPQTGYYVYEVNGNDEVIVHQHSRDLAAAQAAYDLLTSGA